jgi:sec-independent protein translocase protein TatB
MLPAMFGMGGSEILVILIVALIFLGPDKLPEAAKQISKGIRDIKKQSRALQQTIEDDENIGGALRDLRSALRGEESPTPPKRTPPKQLEATATPDPVVGAAALAVTSEAAAASTEAGSTEAGSTEAGSTEAGSTEAAEAAAPKSARDPHEHDAEVAASVFADSFESGHMAAPATTSNSDHTEAPAPRITLPPTAGEPDHDAASPASASGHDADLAALVKPAPNTIARGAASSTASSAATGAASGAADKPEPEHG